MNNAINEIEQLAHLRDKGILTEDEFQRKKTELLSKVCSISNADIISSEKSGNLRHGSGWARNTFWKYMLLSVLVPIVGIIVGIIAMMNRRKLRQGLALIVVSLGITFFYFVVVVELMTEHSGWADSWGTKHSDVVQIVRHGHLIDYESMPLGEAYERFLENPKWQHIKDEYGRDYVTITGHRTHMGEISYIRVIYEVYPNRKSFKFYALEFDGQRQYDFWHADVIKAMYND